MNYKIIKDEKILRGFIDWLPELEENEKYYLCLFARNKYCKELTHIKSDKAQLKRFVSDKERMYEKIKQLEIEIGCYKQKDTPVPEDALALYITPNPRNMYKATVNTMVKLAHSIRDNNVSMNPHQEALSEIQKAKSRTCWIDFDLDLKEEINTEQLHTFIWNRVNIDAVQVLKTRGGFHILINPKMVHSSFIKTFYNNFVKAEGIDQSGDQMIPVPGCTQGMFVPHFISLKT